jgi:hypothetical protein
MSAQATISDKSTEMKTVTPLKSSTCFNGPNCWKKNCLLNHKVDLKVVAPTVKCTSPAVKKQVNEVHSNQVFTGFNASAPPFVPSSVVDKAEDNEDDEYKDAKSVNLLKPEEEMFDRLMEEDEELYVTVGDEHFPSDAHIPRDDFNVYYRKFKAHLANSAKNIVPILFVDGKMRVATWTMVDDLVEEARVLYGIEI